jgi:CRP-like cAMP-binding protein
VVAGATGASEGRGSSDGLRDGFGGKASGVDATTMLQAPVVASLAPPIRPSPKPRRTARDGLLELLVGAKGPLRVGQEGLAEALGVTSARVRQLLKELAATGTIRVRTSPAGTTITLLEGGRA